MFGLINEDIEYIKKAFSKHKEIEKVLIFGSRAIGNYKKASDIDLAILGSEISKRVISEVFDDLNEVYPLPYFFDLLIYDEIKNENLKKHIDEFGKSIYEKGEKR